MLCLIILVERKRGVRVNMHEFASSNPIVVLRFFFGSSISQKSTEPEHSLVVLNKNFS